MTDTQRQAFESIRDTLGERQQEVLNLILRRPISAPAVAKRLYLPINCVSGRMIELRKAGLIEDSGSRVPNPASGRSVILWRAAKQPREDAR